MDRPKYNARGHLVTNPLVYYDIYGNIISAPIEKYTNVEVIMEKIPSQIVKFNPTKNFGLSVTKDDDCNIDVNLRFNPKRFFVGATDTIIAYQGLKKLISGIKKV